ncbi:MAG TPA: type II 3-dehydroquinate dehydratase [Acidimicrobiia bacterium]|nr:type II 3-dehydroquinate dehydratase [Acidimicrobiia bacterium]
MIRVLVLNGPNLDLLGTRQPPIYGSTTLVELADQLRVWGQQLQLDVHHFQSNHEGEIIERIHDAPNGFDALILNAGALTHYAYALQDAIEAVQVPAIEVHISNIRTREAWRRHSVIAPVAAYSIHGRGVAGYRWALLHIVHRLRAPFETVAYGNFADQIGDLRYPQGSEPVPLAILVHGGLWEEQWTRDTTDGWAAALTDRGWATLNIEYRRLGTGGGWPPSFVDLTTAYEFAAALSRVDSNRIVVGGHSAGGTMALWAAGESLEHPPASVVSVAGITDLVRANRENLGNGAIAALFGRRPHDAESISPRHRLPTGISARLVSCLDDDLVDPDYARDFATAASAAGDEVGLSEIGATHMSVLDPLEAANRQVLDIIASAAP